jgi:hypothetical protein
MKQTAARYSFWGSISNLGESAGIPANNTRRYEEYQWANSRA